MAIRCETNLNANAVLSFRCSDQRWSALPFAVSAAADLVDGCTVHWISPDLGGAEMAPADRAEGLCLLGR
jgi:hypothetical protein